MKLEQVDKSVEAFIALVYRGVEAWLEAGRIVSENVDKNPQWVEAVCLNHPEISEETIWAFDRVGRNELNPRLLLSSKPGPRRLRNLPRALQDKHLETPVPLLVQNGKQWETLQVSIWNLTADQAKQVFDRDTVRSEAAQRAWLQSKSAHGVIEQFNEPYRVSGKYLIVMEPCKLSSKQLLNIAAELM